MGRREHAAVPHRDDPDVDDATGRGHPLDPLDREVALAARLTGRGHAASARGLGRSAEAGNGRMRGVAAARDGHTAR